MDIKILEGCVRSNLGDFTFKEAYEKTGRILNITVASTKEFEVPRLLNYLTAPNVVCFHLPFHFKAYLVCCIGFLRT